ncbi:cytochrome c-type biogenesis protein [Erwinia psidii]|uniref:Cytochrome c-type biogenesis protein n=1 Tax=Erwinia psidii TaxID=69224 RepID=A0A3N6UVN1_9GAMM|nr:cytochrome c-type biogenesis protein CcmH [Erwinia psidii]MCX8956672.1 cytochrome c-type biogenesis protein CcmH [Erwinia psidii]MCX8961418.1 cytochrome c-type biogenesis protein CcmH [Erwinia psidii]MCX8965113.1 cytochrome c-type biogenesis protein CcmH [Erwinia psidii]RQM39999.1 cytochrome c-type biogenesis protein CcmH [Erwinia psidii]
MKHCIIMVVALLLAFNVLADNINPTTFSFVEQQQYRYLTETLYCPVCHNKSIADSGSTIAAEMRLRVGELLEEKYTPDQVKVWMVEHYGEAVTSPPQADPPGLILWVGPVLFVFLGTLFIILQNSTRQISRCDREVKPQMRMNILRKDHQKQTQVYDDKWLTNLYQPVPACDDNRQIPTP